MIGTLCSASVSLMLAWRLKWPDADCQGGNWGRLCSCLAAASLGDIGVGGARFPIEEDDACLMIWLELVAASAKVQFKGDRCAEPGTDFMTRP